MKRLGCLLWTRVLGKLFKGIWLISPISSPKMLRMKHVLKFRGFFQKKRSSELIIRRFTMSTGASVGWFLVHQQWDEERKSIWSISEALKCVHFIPIVAGKYLWSGELSVFYDYSGHAKNQPKQCPIPIIVRAILQNDHRICIQVWSEKNGNLHDSWRLQLPTREIQVLFWEWNSPLKNSDISRADLPIFLGLR